MIFCSHLRVFPTKTGVQQGRGVWLSFPIGTRCRQRETEKQEAEIGICAALRRLGRVFLRELQVPRNSPERSWGVPRFRLHRQTCCRAIRESRAGGISSSSLSVSRGGKIASCRRSSSVHVCENSLDVFVVFEFIEEFFDFTHLFFGVILGVVGNALRARFLDFDPQFLNR